jgi:SAM-dependent methyltransferase
MERPGKTDVNPARENVTAFYSGVGWETDDAGVTEDALRFEDLRPSASSYAARTRSRVLRHLPASGERLLDVGSGPIQYPEYLELSRGFGQHYCVDLSPKALAGARSRIGEKGVFIQGDILDVDLPPATFDAVICQHVIYHIDRDLQEEAVRKLLRLVKPGAKVVLVYSNPRALAGRTWRLLKRALRLRAPRESPDSPAGGLYFFAHPLEWWNRFDDEAQVALYPWRSFASVHQRLLVPGNVLGSRLLDLLFGLEERFPNLFVRHFQYPIVVLQRR